MSDEIEDSGSAEGGRVGVGAVAMALGGASREKAVAFLEKQSRLADLQIENLRKLDEFEVSHLRWRRFNDQMKGAMQIMLVALGSVVVIAICTAMWNASRAEGLAVDTVSVPPQFAQAGLGGEVIADDLTNKIAAVRDLANEHSIAHSKDVKEERDEDIKVEIPDTGISFGEVSRYLRSWLGHERHLGGNLRNLGNGQIALTVALGGADAATFTGPEGDLGKLEQQAAEHVFQSVDPLNYILYLGGMGRRDEVLPAVMHLIRVADSPGMLSDGYSLWGNTVRNYSGLSPLEFKLLRIAASIDPRELPPHMEMMFSAADLGHDEEALREAKAIPHFRQEDQYAWREGNGFAHVLEWAAIERDAATGDFSHSVSDPCSSCSFTEQLLDRAEYLARMYENRSDLALDKFAEAAKYAPNWGRLRLEWGNALFYAGQPDESKKQITIAASLDLSTSDKAQLARMNAPHG